MGKKNKKNKRKTNGPKMTREQILAMYSTKSTKSKDDKVIEIDDKNENNNLKTDEIEINIKSENKTNFKAPTLTVMGHVDAGKTSLIDCLKNTKIAENESGGITQSIGSTYIDTKYIDESTKNIKGKFKLKTEIPGVLVIDTPGHKSFSNLRQRGCKICDLAILVIDILDGVKPQTIESIKLLTKNKIPFIIAATKIDKIYGWEPTQHQALRKAIKNQKDKNIMNYLTSHLEDIKYELRKNDVESELYFNNKNPQKTYSIVPISSKTKEGLADLLTLIIYISQTWMNKKITFKNKFKATILESKKDKKDGWIINIILTNGEIKIGDKFAVSTKEGPKIITVRNLFLPDENKFSQVESVKASAGVRIIASNLSNCYAGTHLHLIKNISEEDALNLASNEMKGYWDAMEFKDQGIVIQAETLGELEALSSLAKDHNIDIKNGIINLLSEKDISKTEAILDVEEDEEWRILLYFGKVSEKNKIKLTKFASEKKIKLIISDIIYQLVENYQKYFNEVIDNKTNIMIENGDAVMPCKLRILEKFIFNRGGKNDLVFGVKVTHGKLYKNTPIIVESNKKIIGKVISIQSEKKELEEADTHKEVCIKITKISKVDQDISYGRHFDAKDTLLSNITIDNLKVMGKYFKTKLSKKQWELVKEIKEKLITK